MNYAGFMNYAVLAERIAERAQWMLANGAVDPVLQPELARQVIERAALSLLPEAAFQQEATEGTESRNTIGLEVVR